MRFFFGFFWGYNGTWADDLELLIDRWDRIKRKIYPSALRGNIYIMKPLHHV